MINSCKQIINIDKPRIKFLNAGLYSLINGIGYQNSLDNFLLLKFTNVDSHT